MALQWKWHRILISWPHPLLPHPSLPHLLPHSLLISKALLCACVYNYINVLVYILLYSIVRPVSEGKSYVKDRRKNRRNSSNSSKKCGCPVYPHIYICTYTIMTKSCTFSSLTQLFFLMIIAVQCSSQVTAEQWWHYASMQVCVSCACSTLCVVLDVICSSSRVWISIALVF